MKQARDLALAAGPLLGEPRVFRWRMVARRRRWLLPLVVFSLLLHLLLALLLIGIAGPTPPAEPLPPPSVAMMFESGSRAGPSAPNPSPLTSTPAAPAVPPTPQPAPPAATPPAAPPTPEPAPPQPNEPTQPETAPPPPVPATPPPQASSPPAPDTVAPSEIPLPPPPPPLPTPQVAPPQPIRPLITRPVPRPPVERPVEPRRPPPRPYVPPRSASPFSNPMNLSFGSMAKPDAAPHPSAQSSPQALALGQIARGGFEITPVGPGRAQPGPDWRNALSAWIEAHKYYPEQAVQNGEDGTVMVRVSVDRYGRVQSVELESRSGSQWLDLAAQAMFRGQHLPPFPADMTDPDFTFNLTMHYILIRRVGSDVRPGALPLEPT